MALSKSAIDLIYQEVLQRHATAAEQDAFVALRNSVSADEIRTLITKLPEVADLIDPLVRLYQGAFGRVPDTIDPDGFSGPQLSGLASWVNAERNGTSLDTIAHGFVNSAEFHNIYGSTAVTPALITALYNNVLGRAPDAGGFAFWLSSGLDAGSLLLNFSQSAEFIARSQASVDAFKLDLANGLHPTGPLDTSLNDFVLLGPKWGLTGLGTAGGIVTWAIDATIPASFLTVISAAFTDWAHYANIQFQQVASTASSQIDFSLGWIDGPGMILGQTSPPNSWTKFTSESIEFDSGEGWHLAGSQIVSNGGINLFKLALHEIGHAIGLAHYNATPAVMDPYLDHDPAVTDLQQSDIDGVQALYGHAPASQLFGSGSGAGNDLILGGLGNDIIDSGAGVDTAGYDGFRTQYSIGFHGQTVSGPEGSDQLTNIENIQFADGRMVYDQNDAAAIAYRMYDSAFGRAPDSGGLNYWTAALQKGVSVADIANGFVASPELVATYGPLNNEQFVEQVYWNVLDREGEGAGVTYWTNLLNTHTLSRGQVLAGFSESTEHVQKLAPVISDGIFDVNETAASVARLYDATFNRLPDGNGLLWWKDQVDHGTGLSTVADAFASSAEFQNTYGPLDNQHFVERLYLNVLDRAGEAAGVAGWTAALNNGQMDRGDVLLGFSESLEHQVNTMGVIDHGIWIV